METSNVDTKKLIRYCFLGVFIGYSIGTIVFMIIFTKRMSVPFVTKPWTKAFMVFGYIITILLVISLILGFISIFWFKDNKIYKLITFIILFILLGFTLGCGIPLRKSSSNELAGKILAYLEKNKNFVKEYPQECKDENRVDKCEEYLNLRTNKGGYQLLTVISIWLILDFIFIIYSFYFSLPTEEKPMV